jgi:hypothetical protein
MRRTFPSNTTAFSGSDAKFVEPATTRMANVTVFGHNIDNPLQQRANHD